MFGFNAIAQVALYKNCSEIFKLADEFALVFNSCNIDNIESLSLQINKCCDLIFRIYELIDNKDIWFVFSLLDVYIFDISKVKRILDEKDFKSITRVVICLKLIFDARVSNNESNINKAYKMYKTLFKDNQDLNSKNKFIDLFNAINFWVINSDWQTEDRVLKYTNNAQILKTVQNLKAKLRLSIFEQIKLIKNILSGVLSTEEIIDDLKISKFVDIDVVEIREIVIETKKVLLTSRPIDVICSIYGTQSSFYNNGILSKDDSIIESEIAYNAFLNTVCCENEPKCLIFGASPFFVKKWMQDSMTRGINTVFVNDDALCSCFVYYYKNPRCVGAVRSNVEFVNTVSFKDYITPYANYLVLSDTIGVFNCYDIIDFLNGISFNSFFSLSSDRDFLSNSKTLLYDNFIAESIVLPRGLIKTNDKRLKTFWCIHRSNKLLSDNVTLVPCKISGGKIKYITIDKMNEENVALDVLLSSGKSLRKYISKGQDKNNDVEQRKPRTLIQFSKEIDFAYTLSYPKSENGNARIRAYCLESSDGYISDYKGNVCKPTVKIASIKDEEIENWLFNIYPFSKSRKTGSEKNIRSTISEIFIKNLIDYQNLSLKTAWYINEECEERLTEEQKKLLKRVMMSRVGNLNYNNATYDDYIGILEQLDFNDKEYDDSVLLISIVLDYLCKIRWLSHNVIDQALSENYFESRKLTLIRSNIAKKTFTDNEFRKVVESTAKNISNGDLSCLGVLIRLLTGLEPNIICALTWSDYVRNKTFGFSQFYIYKQFTNNGKDIIGFEKNESYRTIPVCSYLSAILDNVYEKVKVEYPNDYLDRYILNFLGHDEKTRVMSPYKLSQNCKKEIENLNIDTNIITIPKKDGGTIETDLSKYAGDIFRSNYIYRLTKAMLSADDIRFLTGRKRATTVGQYYLDYNSDRYQFALYTKTERILDTLISKRKYKNITSKLNENESNKFDVVSDSPVEFDITVELKSIESNKTAEVSIETMYGFTAEIM